MGKGAELKGCLGRKSTDSDMSGGPHQTPHAGFEWPQFGAFSGSSALAFEKTEERERKKKDRKAGGRSRLT